MDYSKYPVSRAGRPSVNQRSGAQKFMRRIQKIRKVGLKHMKLPFWNMCFHFKYLLHISREKTTTNLQLFSIFKEHTQYFRGLQDAFFRTD